MSSASRHYAQRNTNNTQLIPQFYDNISYDFSSPNPFNITFPIDISGVANYTLNLPNVQNVGGVYFVDMSGVDLSGDLLDLSGQFVATTNDNRINMIMFSVNIPPVASYVTGTEFTIFFKNMPYNRFLPDIPLVTIGINFSPGFPAPYILSPPLPAILGPAIYNSVTFKSDGTNYNVVSSGPAGWIGPGLMVALVTV